MCYNHHQKVTESAEGGETIQLIVSNDKRKLFL